MCFCFDGEGAVAKYRSPNCERRPAATTSSPVVTSGESGLLAAAGLPESADAVPVRRLAVAPVPMY